ncbi:MAG: hypothetical protein M4D80_25855 [Myxococcota bacterium]|nr:hypothetical protein [Myxococcota bacterium]
MLRRACAAALLAVAACGAREVTPAPDYGPPPEPVDPITCPATRLERFATRAGATITITTEPVIDAARIDKVPCKSDEPDDACLARARKRPTPSSYEVTGVTIGGDDAPVEYTFDLDGRRITEQADSMQKMVARLKALQAKGHKVVLLRGESVGDSAARHAAIAYRGVGVQERRIATLVMRPTKEHPPRDLPRAMADAQAYADDDRLEIRSMQATDDSTITITVTCGAGTGS